MAGHSFHPRDLAQSGAHHQGITQRTKQFKGAKMPNGADVKPARKQGFNSAAYQESVASHYSQFPLTSYG